MTDAPTHATLAAALAAVQAEMPSVHKGKTANVGQYRYTYADLADVSAAILPLLSRNGLAFTCHPRRAESGYELAATLLHVSGETIEGALPISGNQPQQIGSSITYARRYLLGCLTGIVTDDDDDAQVAQATPKRRAAQQRQTTQPAAAPEGITMPQSTALHAAFNDAGITAREGRLDYCRNLIGREIATSNELTKAEASRVIEALKQDVQGAA